MMRVELFAKMAIWRRCDSEVQWHLNPFSSRHCFWHIWQYHRSFWRPLALILFDIALGEKKSCLGILLLQRGGGVL